MAHPHSLFLRFLRCCDFRKFSQLLAFVRIDTNRYDYHVLRWFTWCDRLRLGVDFGRNENTAKERIRHGDDRGGLFHRVSSSTERLKRRRAEFHHAFPLGNDDWTISEVSQCAKETNGRADNVSEVN